MRRATGLRKAIANVPLRPAIAPTFSTSDLAAVALIAAVVAVWVQAAGGAFSLAALAACEAVFLTFYLVGSLLAGWPRLATGILFDLPLRLLAGYLAVNTALFLLALLSPLGIVADFAILGFLAALVFIARRPAEQPVPPSPGVAAASKSDEYVALLVIGVCLIAATLWCQDSIRPRSVEGETVVFKPWIDGFYHAVHIRIFGASHGWRSIEDFRLAGVPARPYHYASYLTAALIRQASGISSYTAFAGILAPMGVFFTGLGAYALVGSVWGRWAGLAACVALFGLPDGAQQGMHNTFMSYHWLTQISPSATYGLALLAVAWLFVLVGCLQGRRLQVLVGWAVAAILVFYKAHFFLANALLLLLVPPVFFRAPLGARKRILWAGTAIAAYTVTIISVRNLPGLPLIRFDGSCVGKVLGLVKSFTRPGMVRDFIIDRIGPDMPLLHNLLVGTPFVLLAALGVFLPVLCVLAARLRKRTPAVFLLFPFVLIVNFLAMFFGLALDMRSSTPDELSHRPVMIVYFFVLAWVGGAGGLLLLRSRRLGRVARPAMVVLAVILMAVPGLFGSGVHRMWAMPYISPPLRIPAGLVLAAQYMREHGNTQDLFQDSQFDRACAVAALSDRAAFVARSMTRLTYNLDQVEDRVAAIQEFMSLRDANAIPAKARALGFRWFLADPVDNVDWPKEIADHPAFSLNGYRLYRF